MPKILIFDDDAEFIEILKERLAADQWALQGRLHCAQAVQDIEQEKPEAVLLDVEFGRQRQAGLEALKQIRARWPKHVLPVLMLSGTGDARVLAAALKHGANDYLFKPVDNFPGLLGKLKALLRETPDAAGPGNLGKEEEPVLLGTSRKIMEINRAVIKAAQLGKNVLFQGESGTGKEVAARLYREYSPRKARDLVVVNCPGIPGELFESEVFGYCRGAFANAGRDQAGLAEKADGGIIFFDEIGHLSAAHQTKLLRFIQFGTFKRLGSNAERKSDAVILAATSRNLKDLMRQGGFLKELYYRFERNEIVNLIPLRERKEDIPSLARHFLAKYGGPALRDLDQELLNVFGQMAWEGNVRQLENCVMKAARKCTGETLTLRDAAEYLSETVPGPESAKEAEADFASMDYTAFSRYEKEFLARLRAKFYTLHLQNQGGNISRTAKKLGMTREYLYQLLKKMRLHVEEP